MALRSNGPLAGFGWLARAINLGRHNAKAVFGGAVLVLLAVLLPTLITLPLQFGAMAVGSTPSPTTMALVMGFSSVVGLFLVPVYVGYVRVIDAAERGQPTRARGVFSPYGQGEVLRLAGYGLAMMLVYLAVFGAILFTVGRGLGSWYLQLLSAQMSHALPPPLPAGVLPTFALMLLLGLWMMGVYAISLGQVALRGRSVLGAIGDGLLGSAKNALPLLTFAIGMIGLWIVVGLCIGLAALLLGLVAKLVGLWLMAVLAIVLYVALLLVMMVVMFGVMYYLWRDVCDDGAAPTVTPAIAA